MPNKPKVILFIETSRAYGQGLLYGIAKYSRLHGPWGFYREPQFYFKRSNDREMVLSKLKKWDAAGIIARVPDLDKANEILSLGLPTVISAHFGDIIPNSANIVTDDKKIGQMVANHMLERGFKHFAFFGSEETFYGRGRLESFCQTIAQAGFEATFQIGSKRSKERTEREPSSLGKWLDNLPKPVGIMACTDDDSQRLAEECKMTGLHVPEEVAIIGVDNDVLVCTLSDPPLSSVALNTERAGYEAAELLDRMMKEEKKEFTNVIVQPSHIITRQSSDILAIADEDVAQAVRFIREHCRQTIQVSDVVNHVPLSRRVLEQRFRKVLGRSILDEIKRIRIEQICQMLMETNLPVAEIAANLGYLSVDHIARYFREKMDMSPLAYRKQFGPKK